MIEGYYIRLGHISACSPMTWFYSGDCNPESLAKFFWLDMYLWTKEHLPSVRFVVDYFTKGATTVYACFYDERDAVQFKLIWGEDLVPCRE